MVVHLLPELYSNWSNYYYLLQKLRSVATQGTMVVSQGSDQNNLQ